MKLPNNVRGRPTHAELKSVRELLTTTGRRLQKKFIAEGIRVLEEAIRFRFWPETAYTDQSGLDTRAHSLIENFSRHGVHVLPVSTKELQKLSDTKTTQGIVAVFQKYDSSSAQQSLASSRTILLCDNISDPGNLGTLYRSALAFGISTIVLLGHNVDPYSPKVVRSSAGALFGLHLFEMSYGEVLKRLREHNVYLVAAEANGKMSMDAVIIKAEKRKIALAIGSEAEGLSKEIHDAADSVVTIRHSSKVESLNAAVAGSILLKELFDLQQRSK